MIWLIRLGLCLGLFWVTYVRTDGFFQSYIEGPLPPTQAEVPPAQIQKILSQPFHYLGKGRQCFVFESPDKTTVLKFFNRSYIEEPWYTSLLPKSFRLKEKAKRAKRKEYYLHSYEIAGKELGEEILYLHLGASQELPVLSLTDKGGRKFKVDLNRVPFVLQKKGVLLYSALDSIYEKQGVEGLRQSIEAFLRQVAGRIALNILDGDQDVEHNWGMVDGHLFHLDPGRLSRKEGLLDPNEQKREWWAATHNFRKWLVKNHSELVPYFDERLTFFHHDIR